MNYHQPVRKPEYAVHRRNPINLDDSEEEILSYKASPTKEFRPSDPSEKVYARREGSLTSREYREPSPRRNEGLKASPTVQTSPRGK
mmetsp:Transcript_29493/g.44810  ORF Transcript_29493/g.44810 Transcript_29493/m.44810 type:complete len:87 (+) Transcript_29493:1-261(+)